MGLISWILVGLIAGVLAKWIIPGTSSGSLFITILLGMGGAVIGGFVVRLLGGTGATGFNVWSILVATLGAVILLLVYDARRPTPHHENRVRAAIPTALLEPSHRS